MIELLSDMVAGLWGMARRAFTLAVAVLFVLTFPSMTLGRVRSGAHGGRATAVSARQVAARVVITGATPFEEGEIRDALSFVRYPLNPNLFAIDVTDKVPSSLGGVAGWYSYPASVISLKRDAITGQPEQVVGQIIAHELGHMVDLLYLDDHDRALFSALRRHPEGTSWQGDGLDWGRRPCEDFAEVFASLEEPMAPGTIETVYGPVRDQRPIAALIQKRAPGDADTLGGIQTERAVLMARDGVRSVATTPAWWEIFKLVAALFVIRGAKRGVARMHRRDARALRRVS